MDHSSETANLDRADEDILTVIVSDEALEVAATGTARYLSLTGLYSPGSPCTCGNGW